VATALVFNIRGMVLVARGRP